jgi:Tfp pilus assembly protein PilO
MNEKQVTIIAVAILAFVLLAGGVITWYLYAKKLAGKKAELVAAENAVKDAGEKRGKIKGLEEQNQKLAKDIKEKQKQIPDLTKLEYDQFANLLDDLRRRANVAVSSADWIATDKMVKAVKGRPGGGLPPTIHKVQYTLMVTGGFYQLLKFVNLLEQEHRFIAVQNFSLSQGPGAKPARAAKGGETAPPSVLLRDMKITLYSFTYRVPRAEAEKALPPVERKSTESTPLPE